MIASGCSFAVQFVGLLEAFAALMAGLIFYMENGRLPGRRAWRPYVESGSSYQGGGKATVGVRRGSEKIALEEVSMAGEDYEARLDEAVSQARVRALTLSGSDRHARRKLGA